MRNHEPITLKEFNGLWRRSDEDNTPLDHFSGCNNIKFTDQGFQIPRDGIDTYIPLGNVVRMYTFTQESGSSLIILDSDGNIWDSNYLTTPILTVVGMTDFGFVSMNGRAYLSPSNGNTGLNGEVIYVYEGDGTVARAAAGAKPTTAEGALAAANSATAGNVEAGIHVFGVAYETDTGFITAIGPGTLPTVTADGTKKVDLSAIPVSPNSYITRVHLLASKLIQPQFYTGDPTAYQLYFIPDADVANGTTTATVNFFDSELLEDASYLYDLYEEIPAGAGLGIYHNRLLSWAEYDNISVVRVSVAGEPEAINQVDGLLIFPLDGRPITNAQEFRDVLYVDKRTKTNAWTDNGDVPSSWPMTVMDQGIGSSLHTVAKVLDSEGVNVDYLIIGSLSGIVLFNGSYSPVELTYKIYDLWMELDSDTFNQIQILNDNIKHLLYVVLPDGTMLIGDYNHGLDPKTIRWTPVSADINITCLALINLEVIIGSDGER